MPGSYGSKRFGVKGRAKRDGLVTCVRMAQGAGLTPAPCGRCGQRKKRSVRTRVRLERPPPGETRPLSRARVLDRSAVEVVELSDGLESCVREEDLQQGAEFSLRAATEIVGGTRDELPAFLPVAGSLLDRGREERIELCAARRIHAVGAGVRVAERRVDLRALDLDGRQVGLERHLRIILALRRRAGEQNC